MRSNGWESLCDEEAQAHKRGLIPLIRNGWNRVDFLMAADRMEEEGYDVLAAFFRDVAYFFEVMGTRT